MRFSDLTTLTTAGAFGSAGALYNPAVGVSRQVGSGVQSLYGMPMGTEPPGRLGVFGAGLYAWESPIDTLDAAGNAPPQSYWDNDFARLERKFETLEKRTLIEMRHMAQQLDALRSSMTAVAQLSRSAQTYIASTPSSVYEEITGVSATIYLEVDKASPGYWNMLAENDGCWTSESDAQAESALASEDAAVRAAAGRALANNSPDVAKRVLPKFYEQEVNKYARAVLRGALRAANA